MRLGLIELALWNIWALTGLLFAVAVGLYVFGYASGRRRVRNGNEPTEGAKLVSGAILALTAFVLALTLSFASTRMQERRDEGKEEANAIGTAWLQAKAVGGPEGEAIAAMFETYIGLRRDSLLLDAMDPRIEEVASQIGGLQTTIWSEVTSLVRARPDPVASSLMNAVNHAFDMTTSERLAVSNQMPVQLTYLLLSLVFVGIFVVGFQLGFVGRPHVLLSVVLIALWTYVVVLILDFGNSRVGVFRTSTTAYDMTIAGFGAPPD